MLVKTKAHIYIQPSEQYTVSTVQGRIRHSAVYSITAQMHHFTKATATVSDAAVAIETLTRRTCACQHIYSMLTVTTYSTHGHALTTEMYMFTKQASVANTSVTVHVHHTHSCLTRSHSPAFLTQLLSANSSRLRHGAPKNRKETLEEIKREPIIKRAP